MRIWTRMIAGAAVAAVALALSAGTAPGQTTATTVAPPAPGDRVSTDGTTRTVLAVARPADAAGRVMVLTRVTIAPGAKLAEHFHAGTQILRIESGALTLRVAAGSLPVTRADGSTAAGATLDLEADFAVTENRLVTLATPGGTRLAGTAVETATAADRGAASSPTPSPTARRSSRR